MTSYKRRDVVLLDFGFSESAQGSKKRPALVISSDAYHQSRREVIVAAITSNITRVLFADTKVEQWKEAGLLYPSLVTGIIRTVKDGLIIRRLGVLSPQDLQRVRKNIIKAIG